jgi:hypothetical protein
LGFGSEVVRGMSGGVGGKLEDADVAGVRALVVFA